MDETVNKICNFLKGFLKLEGENRLELVVRTQVRKCLNYMNREDFPDELVESLAEAIALEYLEEEEREVKRVTAGDTSVEYNSSSSVTDRVAVTMREQLNRFRRVGTIGTTAQK